MTSRDFVYWLQGFFEIAPPGALSKDQVKTIKRHIGMVFVHEIDPSMGDEEHQQALDAVHTSEIVDDEPPAITLEKLREAARPAPRIRPIYHSDGDNNCDAHKVYRC